ncbi:hypothetical protein [Methyloversatilis sp.]
MPTEFLTSGLASRDRARETGRYTGADEVFGRLDAMLAKVRAGE